MTWRQASPNGTTGAAKAGARRLRRCLTEAEKVLWRYLRGDFAGRGSHFRRQFPVGPYIADFCCLSRRVIVELDGPIHASHEARRHDRKRDAYLEAQGFAIVRFHNRDVMSRRDDVLQAIKAALGATTPTPYPSPQGGGDSGEVQP